MRRLAAVLALAGVLGACGDDKDDDNGGGGGGGSSVAVTGGTSGTLSNATALRANGQCSQPTDVGTLDLSFSTAFIVVTSATIACQALQQGNEPRNTTSVLVTVERIGVAQSAPLATGTYSFYDFSGDPPVDDQNTARVMFGFAKRSGSTPDTVDGGCVAVSEASITSGTVTITNVSASSISGTISAGLDDGGTVTGSFTAPTCAVTLGVGPTTCELTGLPDTATCQ
jgi:hypothetical protein